MYKQELDLDLEQVQDLICMPEPCLDMELLTQMYKWKLGLESLALETKVQLLKFDSLLMDLWSLLVITLEPVDFDMLMRAGKNTVYWLQDCYN